MVKEPNGERVTTISNPTYFEVDLIYFALLFHFLESS